MHNYLITVFFLLIGQKCSAYDISPPIPIINPQPGFRYNPLGPFQPNVKLEMFVDLNCPDSRDGLPVVKNVADHYGNTEFNLVIQLFPLAYHRNAFLSSQGLYVIREHLPMRAFNFIEAMLGSYPAFSNDATSNMTETEVLEMMADVAVQSTAIDRALFISDIGKYRNDAIRSWKYAIREFNTGTPSYHLNGVDLVIAGMPDFNDWIKFLDPIVKSPASSFVPRLTSSKKR